MSDINLQTLRRKTLILHVKTKIVSCVEQLRSAIAVDIAILPLICAKIPLRQDQGGILSHGPIRCLIFIYRERKDIKEKL